jgi:iron complex outermembrane recepter protein
MDIKRSEDDVQPYVIFTHEDIERSGATSLNNFFKERLTMNSVGLTASQTPTSANGNVSRINLRGLGVNQTLILVDGRRMASSSSNGVSLGQPDINGIPVAAVERIEILPTTASGIYGGGATGGVINIILRRDYSGAELKATYDNSFDGDAPIHRMDLSAGFNLEEGKTNILVAGSYSDHNVLTTGERNLVQRGRAKIMANNPSFLLDAATPPLGATPNIRSLNGSPLFGPNTPNFTSVPVGYAGGGGLAALQANAGRYNLDLANSAQSSGAKSSLLNGPRIESAMATVRRQFGDKLQAFAEFAGTNNIGDSPATLASGGFTIAANAPNNPFGQQIRVAVPIPQASESLVTDNRNRRAALGAILELSPNWHAEADYTWTRSHSYSSIPGSTSASATTVINNGTLDVLRDPSAATVDFGAYFNPRVVSGPFRATLEDATVRLAGRLGSLPAGPITVSGLVEHRRESLADGYQISSPTTSVLFPNRSQSINSVYLETRLPMISGAPGADGLEVQLAARWDQYKINGATGSVVNPTPSSVIVRRTNETDSIDPTVGVRYQPLRWLTMRASYGTGFFAPGVDQLIPNAPNSTAQTVIDPRRGSAATTLPAGQIVGGGNPDLQPEESESWSVGVIFAPPAVPGLRASIDYTKIDKSDEISTTLGVQQIIDNEVYLPGRITRGAPTSDPLGVGIITAVNATGVNLARSEVEAIDVALDFEQNTGIGIINLFANATRQLHHKTQLLPTSPLVENVGITSSFPLEFRANGGITWSLKQWSSGWSARYFDSYSVADRNSAAAATTIANQGSAKVSSQVYHDFFASYRVPPGDRVRTFGTGLFSDMEFRLGITNVFNSSPPFDASNTVSFYSYFGDPRLRSYYVSLKKAF